MIKEDRKVQTICSQLSLCSMLTSAGIATYSGVVRALYDEEAR
jgi:hypothetical protein